VPKEYDRIPDRFYTRVGKICLRFPEVENKPFGGHVAPAFRVRDKIFVGTGQVGRPRLEFKAGPGVQQALVGSNPDRFFVPKYVGSKGWTGAWLDVEQDWDEIAELCEEAYRLVAPNTLVKQLDEAAAGRAKPGRDATLPLSRRKR
jgi:predicted DNA-binding protein (MmcQ/YjbR family)